MLCCVGEIEAVKFCNPTENIDQREERESKQADERHFADAGLHWRELHKREIIA